MKSTPRLLWRLFLYTRPYRRRVVIGLGAWVVMVLLEAVIPQLVARAIDQGIDGQNPTALAWFSALATGLWLARAGFGFLHAYLYRYWDHRIGRDLRNDYYRKLMHLDYAYFDRANTGDLITRGISDVDMMRQWTGLGMVEMFTTVGLFTVMFATMILTNWRLALFSAIVLPVLAVMTRYFGKGAIPLIATVRRMQTQVTNRLAENLNGVRVVRAYGREDDEIERYTSDSRRFMRSNVHWIDFWAWLVPSMHLVSAVGTVLLLGVGGLMVMNGQLTIGALIAFNVYHARLLHSVRRSGGILQRTAAAITSADRMFEVLDTVPSIHDAPDAKPLVVREGRVKFEHVSLKYHTGAEVLHDIAFEIPPRSTVALVGPTGSGKTSIVGLLGRFYDPTAGRVTIDGQDLREVTLDSLRRNIGIVPQDVLLFADSVGRNLSFARPKATQDQVVAAATAAEAHRFIDALPAAYETMLGERGTGLSGGQRQRSTIARALLPSAPVLILDDSTSALDTQTERLVLDTIFGLDPRSTCLIVAQRLSAARRADQIFVIEEGRITQRGTHDALVREPGLYQRMWREQASMHEEAPTAEKAPA